MQHKQQLEGFNQGAVGKALAAEEAHLLEGVFEQRLPGNVDLDVAGQSVGLWGRRSVAYNVEGKSGQRLICTALFHPTCSHTFTPVLHCCTFSQ